MTLDIYNKTHFSKNSTVKLQCNCKSNPTYNKTQLGWSDVTDTDCIWTMNNKRRYFQIDYIYNYAQVITIIYISTTTDVVY